MVGSGDREILRGLAGRVREIAELPEMAVRKKRWRGFMALKPERPMVLCYPEGAWGELMADTPLLCVDERLRGWEWTLRTTLYQWERICDDNTVEPWFNIGWRVSHTGFGVEVKREYGENRGSYRWDPPIKDLDNDLPRLRMPDFTVDRAGTMAGMELADSIFGDLLPPRLRGIPHCSGMTWLAVDLIGLDNLMLAMYDNPHGLHALMAFIQDFYKRRMEWYEAEGLLCAHNENDYVGSGGVAYTDELPGSDEKGRLTLKDVWGWAESQETVGVSPAMFREFVLPYQAPLLAMTGLNHYGCCEPIHDRLDDLLKLPNMRRISVSPWTNEAVAAEKLGTSCIYSRKPNPAIICASFDPDEIRGDIGRTLDIARGCAIEFIMKDTHTVQHHPERISEWVRIAYAEIGV